LEKTEGQARVFSPADRTDPHESDAAQKKDTQRQQPLDSVPRTKSFRGLFQGLKKLVRDRGTRKQSNVNGAARAREKRST